MLIKYFKVPRTRIIEKSDGVYLETTYHPVGCMVGEVYAVDWGNVTEYEYAIGVSWCHPNDTFNKKLAHEIAKGRMVKGAKINIPSRYKKYEYQLQAFLNRLEKMCSKAKV